MVRVQVHKLIQSIVRDILRRIEPRIDIKCLTARIAQRRIDIPIPMRHRWQRPVLDFHTARDSLSEGFAARRLADVLGADLGRIDGTVGVLAVAAAVHPERGFLHVAFGEHGVEGLLALEDGEEEAGFVPAAFDFGEADLGLAANEFPIAGYTFDVDGACISVDKVLGKTLG